MSFAADSAKLEAEIKALEAENLALRKELRGLRDKQVVYDKFLEHMRAGKHFTLGLYNNELKPTSQTIDILGLSEYQVEDFEFLKLDTYDLIKEWESKNAKVEIKDENTAVIEIPECPKEILDFYYNGVQEIIGKDYTEIMLPKFYTDTEQDFRAKQLTMILTPPAGELKVVFAMRGKFVPWASSGIKDTFIIDLPPWHERWGHVAPMSLLIKEEEAEAAAEE